MFFVKKITIFICCILTINSSSCNNELKKYPELAKFIKKYSCSPDIENKRKENPDNFFLKLDIKRIINAERMKNIIKEKNLDHLVVAQKCLTCDKNGFLKVVSQKVKSKSHDSKISLVEIKQLVTLAEETGYRDWVSNICYDEQDRIAFYDTENMSFAINLSGGIKGIDLPAHSHCKVNYVAHLLNLKKSIDFEVEAQEWITQRINELENSLEGITYNTPLHENTRYDDPEINFEQVKKEYEDYMKALRNKNKN